MFQRLAPIFLICTACNGFATTPHPDRVTLTSDRLTVFFTNGTRCHGAKDKATATENGWAGNLQDCPFTHAYSVQIDPKTNPLRYVLLEFISTLGGDKIFSPVAGITITDTRGREFLFNAPDFDRDDR